MFGVVTVDRQWYAGGTWNPNALDENDASTTGAVTVCAAIAGAVTGLRR